MGARPRLAGGAATQAATGVMSYENGCVKRSDRAVTAKNEEQSERGGIIQSCTYGIIYS